MNRIAAKAFIFAILSVVVFNAPSDSNAQEWARKMLTEYVHDFGEVNKGDMPEYRFQLKNLYKEDMNISRVFSSCGCTQVSVSKRQLKSLETAEIICRFNSKPFNGFKQATVTVQFGPPMIGEVQLTVKGTIVSAIRLSPEKIDFGQVSRGKTPTFQTTLTGPRNMRIVDVKSTFPHVGVSMQGPMPAGNQTQFTLQTRLKDSAPDGFSQGDLFIIVDESGRQRQIPLSFSAKMASAIKISPAVLTINGIKPGETVSKKVIVRADEPFQITDVKCRTRAFRVSAKKAGMSKTHIVDVSYTGEEKTGRHECELTFFTSLSSDAAGKVKAVIEFEPGLDAAPITLNDR